MRDFMDGDIKVKVVDDSELVIEGSVEKRRDGAVSKKTFCRRFSFPGLLSEDAVSSSMSADGVLTVTVPKKVRGKSCQMDSEHNHHFQTAHYMKTFTDKEPSFT